MTPSQLKRISKFLSLVLRHQPDQIGLELDAQGWADVEELLTRLQDTFPAIDRSTLDQVVRENDKQRFAFSPDGLSIRASQGHSLAVDLAYTPLEPPEQLYHGTTTDSLESIRKTGLLKRQRQHVHLSSDRETAYKVGQRHGPPVILTIRSGAMHQAGQSFFCSANGVWLTETVPPEFIDFADRRPDDPPVSGQDQS